MAELPEPWSVPVVRADFTDDAAWERIREKITEPTEDDFGADVDFVEDRALAGLDEAAIVAGYPARVPAPGAVRGRRPECVLGSPHGLDARVHSVRRRGGAEQWTGPLPASSHSG